MIMKRISALALLTLCGAQSALSADVASQPSLTLEGAKRVVAAAVAFARSHNAPGGAIAVVDVGGHTMYLERLDGTFPAGADISIGKARTAVMFKRPTRGIEETINKGRTAMVPVAEVTWFTPLQGGIPIMSGDQIVGGIGVSGASSAQQDEEVAIAGAMALQAEPATSQVQHVPARQVAQAFSKGETGETLVSDSAFRVAASRRDGPGQAEVHASDTDVFYVLEGSATVITGGDLVNPRELAPGETRGEAIRGGTEHRLAKGDVFTIPSGVPHWFKTVETPFRYYVIKSVVGS
jgi:glc operon protein GlcG